MKLLLFLILLPIVTYCAAAQGLTADSAQGAVGQEVRLRLRLTGGDGFSGPVTITGSMKLSNPTVFFPERFVAPEGDSVLSFTLSRQNDSNYTFSVTLRYTPSPRPAADTLLYLAGEALAGSGSVCNILFTGLRINDQPSAAFDGTIVTRSIGTPLPYVRFAILEQNYPNPVGSGQSTTWAYRIDKKSDVRFHFYNLVGEEIMVFQLGEVDIGPHTFTFIPDITMPSAVYFIRLITNSGFAEQPFHIVK